MADLVRAAKGLAAIGNPEDLPQNQNSHFNIPGYANFGNLRILVSPYLKYNLTTKETDIIMFNSKNLGALIVGRRAARARVGRAGLRHQQHRHRRELRLRRAQRRPGCCAIVHRTVVLKDLTRCSSALASAGVVIYCRACRAQRGRQPGSTTSCSLQSPVPGLRGSRRRWLPGLRWWTGTSF